MDNDIKRLQQEVHKMLAQVNTDLVGLLLLVIGGVVGWGIGSMVALVFIILLERLNFL